MALMVCSSVVCVTGVGSGVEESVHAPLHSQSSHQSEELPPLMGATKEQWSSSRGTKEAEKRWCEFVTELA